MEFALDERLRLHGLGPVFEAERAAHVHEDEHDHVCMTTLDMTTAADSHNGHVHHREESAAHGNAPAPSKPGRNDPCPCGSGKKYKKCHGA